MGTDHNIACKTCKVEYYLGYGSYAGRKDRLATFACVLKDHDGHDVTDCYGTDYLRTYADGHLWFECPWNGKADTPFIVDYTSYKFINFEPHQAEWTENEDKFNAARRKYGGWQTATRVLQGDLSVNPDYHRDKEFNSWVKVK